MEDTEQRGRACGRAAVKRLDHVAIVVNDLAAAGAFFAELGLDLKGEATLESNTVDRLSGLDGLRWDIAMMRTPDGHGRLELIKYQTPPGRGGDPGAPPTPRASGILCSRWRASRMSSTGCGPMAPNSSASWRGGGCSR
jgi:Glyoxalase/Bleomycin resistance protein/Dioxygenase superfamily